MAVTTEIDLPDPAATDRAGAALGLALKPGDAVMLEGRLGAGKSALVRAAIKALLAENGRSEEVPSPTYTLAQIYETARGPVWHADLYRLGSPEEARELGLSEALGGAICFVEWPSRLGPQRPDGALTARLSFGFETDARRLELSARDAARWAAVVDAVHGAAGAAR